MKKASLIALIAVVFLTSCNLPSADSTPTIPEDQIATAVALTLTSQAIVQEIETITPQPTASMVVVVTPTLAASASPTPTTTLTPTETTTPTTTYTTLPEDPAQLLGAPARQDNFANGKAFGLDAAGYEDENTRITVENGAMVLTSYSQYGYRGWRLTVNSPADFYMEARFETVQCAGEDTFGMVFRAPDYTDGQGYYYGLTCSGKYMLSKWDANGTENLVTSSNDLINPGPAQINRLGVWAEGEHLRLYINGKMITELNDASFTAAGHYGAYIAGQSSGAFTVRMESIGYWNLP